MFQRSTEDDKKKELDEKRIRTQKKLKTTAEEVEGAVIIRHLLHPAPYLHSVGYANTGLDRVVWESCV